MQYSKAFRAQMIKKMAGPDGRSANSLAQEIGVSQGTLSRWLREYLFRLRHLAQAEASKIA